MFIFLWRHYLQIGWKSPKVVYHMSGVRENSKPTIDRTLRNLFLRQFSQNIAVSTPMVTIINPKLGQKGSKIAFPVPMVVERWKSVLNGNSRWSIRFWNHYLRILKFWLRVVTSSTQKWAKKVEIDISCTSVYRKMKIQGKKYF